MCIRHKRKRITRPSSYIPLVSLSCSGQLPDKRILVFFSLFKQTTQKDNKIYFCLSLPRHVNNSLVSPFSSSHSQMRKNIIHYYRFWICLRHTNNKITTTTTTKDKREEKFIFVLLRFSKVLFNVNSFNVMLVIRSLFLFILL